jgi:DNA-binding MarR family transcriptional regulator
MDQTPVSKTHLAKAAVSNTAEPLPEPIAPLEDRLGFWLRMAQQSAFDAFHRAMSPLGLTPGRLAVLLLLEGQPGMRQAVLAESLRVKPSNLTVLLAALEEEGLVRRAEDAANRRANRLHLTAAGRALLKKAKAVEAEVERELAGDMTEAERLRVIAVLRRIAGA